MCREEGIKKFNFLQVYGWWVKEAEDWQGNFPPCFCTEHCRENHGEGRGIVVLNLRGVGVWVLLGTWETTHRQSGVFWEEKRQSAGEAPEAQGHGGPPVGTSGACWQDRRATASRGDSFESTLKIPSKDSPNYGEIEALYFQHPRWFLCALKFEGHYPRSFLAVEIFTLFLLPLSPVYVQIAAMVPRLFFLFLVPMFFS